MRVYPGCTCFGHTPNSEWADWPNLKGRWSHLPREPHRCLNRNKGTPKRRKETVKIGETINNCSLYTQKEIWNKQVFKNI